MTRPLRERWPRRAFADRAGASHAVSGDGSLPLQRLYVIHGQLVEVRGDAPADLARVHAVLRHFGLAPLNARGDGAVTLHLPGRPGAVRLPSGAAPTAEQDGIRAWARRNRIYLGCVGHRAHVDLAAATAEVVLPPPATRLRQDFLIYVLLLLLRRRGLFALHASGVSRDGAGCLFVGPSGGGKSTQTYALIREGWDYLGDDALLLRHGSDGVEALAFGRELRLDAAPDGAHPESSAAGGANPAGRNGKRAIHLHESYSRQMIDRCVPQLLVFPEITPGETSRLVAIERLDALSRLYAQSVVVGLDPEWTPRHLELLARLARQSRSHRLLAGRDLRERPELVSTLLATAAGPDGPPPAPWCPPWKRSTEPVRA